MYAVIVVERGSGIMRIGQRLRRLLAPALVLGAVLTTTAPAEAVVVTVGGLTYDIQTLPAGQSYNDVRPTLETQPWWTPDGSSETLATEFAVAYREAFGGTAPSWTFFGYGAPVRTLFSVGTCTGFFCNFFAEGVPVAAVFTEPPELTSVRPTSRTSSTDYYPGFVWATAVQVPEIDGPVAARMAMTLGVLWLFLLGLRSRRRSA